MTGFYIIGTITLNRLRLVCVHFPAFYFQVETYLQEKSLIQYCNHGQNNCGPFHVLTQFLLATNEAHLDYYDQNFASSLTCTERLKT